MAASDRIDELRHRYAAQPRRYFAPLANALRQSGALEEAVTMLHALLAEYPDHLTGHVVLGQALFDAGALAEARTAFESARALDPGNRVVLRYLGDIASLAGDPAEARLWFGRLRAADPYADDVAAQLGGGVAVPPDGDDAGAEPVAVNAAQEVREPVREPAAVPAAVAEPFELLEFDAVGLDSAESETVGVRPTDADGASSTLDPVVGLDLAPAAVPVELEDAIGAGEVDGAADAATPPSDDAALERITAGPFATETMAGLLAAQGHTQQAIALYERLTTERPGDALLRSRLDALRGSSAELSADDGSAPPAPLAPSHATDAERGALLTAAFADVVPAHAVADAAPALVHTNGDLSDGDPPDGDPFSDVSFDRFFAPATAEVDADLARFDAWLHDAA